MGSTEPERRVCNARESRVAQCADKAFGDLVWTPDTIDAAKETLALVVGNDRSRVSVIFLQTGAAGLSGVIAAMNQTVHNLRGRWIILKMVNHTGLGIAPSPSDAVNDEIVRLDQCDIRFKPAAVSASSSASAGGACAETHQHEPVGGIRLTDSLDSHADHNSVGAMHPWT